MITVVLMLALGVFFGLLIVSTRWMLSGMKVLVASAQIGAYGLASFLLAFSTSLPELLVGISAGIQGEPGLALGTVLGSNIANMSLVLGGAAMVSGVLTATDSFLRREVFYVFLAGSFPMLLLLDKTLSRVDGVILLAVYALYNSTILRQKRKRLAKREIETDPLWRRLLVRVTDRKSERGLVLMLVGVGGLIFSADMIVRLAVQLGTMMGVPALLIGLFAVAVGTSLPELAFEVTAIRRREVQMAFGNILGSVVTNSTLILGVTAILAPIILDGNTDYYLVSTIAFVVVFFAFWGLVWTKHKLERWEGALLLVLYVVFVLMELWRSTSLGGF
jgi:cation:H+ antiporter